MEHGTVAGQLLCTYDWIAIQFKDCELKAQVQLLRVLCKQCNRLCKRERFMLVLNGQNKEVESTGLECLLEGKPKDNNVAPSQFTVSGIAIVYLNRLTG